MTNKTRRELLAAVGSLTALSIAGCSQSEGADDPPQTTSHPTGQHTATTDTPGAEDEWAKSVYEDSVDSVVGVGKRRNSRVIGSGWAIDNSHIVTNSHVSRTDSQLAVWVTNDGWYTATVVEDDPRSDISVLTVDGEVSLEPLTIAQSTPDIGESIVGIGFPQAMHDVYVTGIVTATDGIIEPPDILSIGGFVKTNAVQGAGSSGSPLLSSDGHVIGMTTYGEEFTAIGSSHQILSDVTTALRSGTQYRHAVLGAHVRTATYTETNQLPSSVNHGVTIIGTAGNSPLINTPRSGGQPFTPDDVITMINGTPIRRRAEYRKQIDLYTQPTDTVTVTAYSTQTKSVRNISVTPLSKTY